MLLLPFKNLKSYHIKHKCGEVVVIGEGRSVGGSSATDSIYVPPVYIEAVDTIDYRGEPLHYPASTIDGYTIPGSPATPSTTENQVHVFIYLDYTPGDLFKTASVKGKQSGKTSRLSSQITLVWSSGWGGNMTNTSGWIDGEDVEI